MSKVLISKRAIKVNSDSGDYCIFYDMDYYYNRPLNAKIYSKYYFIGLKIFQYVYNIRTVLCKRHKDSF
jgi:hypothetical protein